MLTRREKFLFAASFTGFGLATACSAFNLMAGLHREQDYFYGNPGGPNGQRALAFALHETHSSDPDRAANGCRLVSVLTAPYASGSDKLGGEDGDYLQRIIAGCRRTLGR